MDKIKAFYKQHRTIIIAVATPVILIAIVMALPIMTVPVQATEAYWEAGTRTENYTATETFTDMESYISNETRTDTVLNEQVSYGGFTRTFNVNNPSSTVTIEVSGQGGGGYYYAPRYFIMGDNFSPSYGPWYGGGGGSGSFGPWYGGYSGYYGPGFDYGYYGGGYGGQSWVTVRVSYPDQSTKYRPVTKTRDVIKYREVPTQIRKERTVTQYVKMSVWQALFR